jgi:predicted aspartyl protease
MKFQFSSVRSASRFVYSTSMATTIALIGVLQSHQLASAQSNLCYMVLPNGQQMNLNGLCGVEPPPAKGSSVTPGLYKAKIKRRDAGTPVIDVMFNGGQTFEMIVDTGASGTVLTPRMASALGVQPVGTALVNTASQKNVQVAIGYVRSVAVSGAVMKDVKV